MSLPRSVSQLPGSRLAFRPVPEPAGLPGLYVHVPFCSAVCPYCDFAVTTGGAAKRRSYVDALLAEIARWEMPEGELDTLYLGGGTPSALHPEQLATIVEALRRRLPFAADTWITLEANPEDVDRARAESWRRLGVRTLSLGVQALDDEALRFLGRRHRRAGALLAVERALETGFTVVSMDLIYALPGQQVEAWRARLREAIGLGIGHLSCYELTVHDGTPHARLFARRPELVPSGDRRADLFLATHRELANAGWDGYEASNFACTESARSRHNQKYWRHVPYLGIGPSAHSFDGRARWWNERQLAEWSAALQSTGQAVAGREELGPEDLRLEALMLGLRTRAGVDLEALQRRCGVDLLVERGDQIAALERAGLLAVAGRRLVPTLEGLAVADGLALRLAG